MLTADNLRKMTPEDRADLFEQLAEAHYGANKTDATIAADFDVRRETVVRWRKERIVPWAVLFTLDQWAHGEAKAQKIMAAWETIPGDLEVAAARLGRIATALAKISRTSAAGASAGTLLASLQPAPSSGR